MATVYVEAPCQTSVQILYQPGGGEPPRLFHGSRRVSFPFAHAGP
jgi:hypothetical protein